MYEGSGGRVAVFGQIRSLVQDVTAPDSIGGSDHVDPVQCDSAYIG